MEIELEYEDRINKAIGKILRYFNFLEMNLGLCIRSLENPKNVEKSHTKLARTSISEKLKKLKSLLETKQIISDTDEFNTWYKSAMEAPSVRNYYIHGTWEYLPLKTENPLGFRIPPWRIENLRGESEFYTTLESLESEAQKIQNVFENFCQIRRKYGV